MVTALLTVSSRETKRRRDHSGPGKAARHAKDADHTTKMLPPCERRDKSQQSEAENIAHPDIQHWLRHDSTQVAQY